MIASNFFLLWSSIKLIFSMLVKEELKSADVEAIKETHLRRAMAKGKVKNYSRSLRDDLISDTNGKFLFDEIDEGMVQETYEKLKTWHHTFQDLHEKFGFFRKEEKDPDEENTAKEKEDSYSNQVTTEFSSIRREFDNYKKALEISIETKKSEAEKKLKEAEDSARELEREAEEKDEDSARDFNDILLADAIETAKKHLDGEKTAARTINDLQDVYVKTIHSIPIPV